MALAVRLAATLHFCHLDLSAVQTLHGLKINRTLWINTAPFGDVVGAEIGVKVTCLCQTAQFQSVSTQVSVRRQSEINIVS